MKMVRSMKKWIALGLSAVFIVTMTVPAGAAVLTGAEVSKTEKKSASGEKKTLEPLKDLPIAWDLTELYPDEEAFEKDMKRVEKLIPEFEKLKGTLNTVDGLVNRFENPEILELNAIIDKAHTFCELLPLLDPSDPMAGRVNARFTEVDQKVSIASAFVDEEIMAIPLEKRKELFSDERLKPYEYTLSRYLDPDKKVLSEEAETVFSLMEAPAYGSWDTRNIFDYVDLPYPTIMMPDGSEEKVSDSLLNMICKDPQYDHEFRKKVIMLRNTARQPYANTYASMMEDMMKAYWAEAQVYGFDSTRKYLMHEADVDPAVYDRIIRFAHDMLPKYHEYLKKRKEILGLDEMLYLEVIAPICGYTDKEISYEDAMNIGRETIAVWGDEYLEAFDKIVKSPHIDVYPAENKDTGAMCGLYGKEFSPFVLYNFPGMESYISTLVHEMGHAVYFELTNENQNEFNIPATIFTQEVASTANEIMFTKTKIENAETAEEKLYWLDNLIALFSGALFRQCLYSEFEDYCYKTIENGGSLNADELSEKFVELQKEYFGEAVTVPDESGIDWARISHFYAGYYVYQYATSITYAASICEQVEKKGQEEIDAYIDFLKAGKSADPVSLLKIANVDPMDDDTYEAVENLLTELIDEFAEVSDKPEGELSGEFPMDPSVMKPWINSNIIGMVTKDVTPDLKDDYYVNVNHDWFDNKKLKPGHDDISTFDDAEDIVTERCTGFLKDDSLSGRDAEMIRNYYNLWLDWDERNKEGIRPAEPIIEKIRAVKDLEDFKEIFTDPVFETFGPSLLSINMGFNAEDSKLYEIKIGTASLSLGDSAEYEKLTKNGERVRDACEEQYRYMLSRFGLTEEEIDDTLEKNAAFEAKLAKYKKTSLEEADASYRKDSVNPVTMEDIREMSPAYPLAYLLEEGGWSESKLINVEEPEFVKGLNGLYTGENLPEIKAYFLTHTAGNFISNLDEEAFRKYQDISKKLSGLQDVEPDEELAYQETRMIFPDSFARIYVEKYLSEDLRQEITDLCEEIVGVYDEMLDTEDWLSEETRQKAKEKLKKLKINAIYPDKWEDDSMFYVTAKEDGGSYCEALKEIAMSARERRLSKLNTRRDDEIWGVDILRDNASYIPPNNSINIYAGLFCDAIYSESMSKEEKMGALGSIIGHEISHAFDTNGALYDGDGNMKDWWKPEDYQAFSEKAARLAAYYDKVVAFDDGLPYQGKMVQAEAIADMAGLKCMLLAAKKSEGFDYDRFFRAFDSVWARKGTLEFNEMTAMTNPHPLHYLRGNVTVQQFDEFLETYGIKEGDGMYLAPEDRILVW